MMELDFEPIAFLIGLAFVVMGMALDGGDILFKCGVVICLVANAIFIYKKTEYKDIPNSLKKQTD